MTRCPAPIAIIGAGLAGMAAAIRLAAAGQPLVLLDKGRGPGGRLSTRRADGWRFDHGGQFATVRDADFAAVMEGLVASGHAARWDGSIVRLGADGSLTPDPTPRHVGTPGMNGLIQGLAARLPADCQPRWGMQVTALRGGPGAWHLVLADGTESGPFAALVLAIPAPQAAALLAPVAADLAARAAAVPMAPCWALMLGFADGTRAPWDAAFLTDAGSQARPLSWIAHDGAKPGRGGAASFVAHAAPDWSQRHLEEAPEQIIARLQPAFAATTGIHAPPRFAAAHRWRYALPQAPLTEGFLWSPERGIGLCGDWCAGARAEAAFISGHRLAGAIAPP